MPISRYIVTAQSTCSLRYVPSKASSASSAVGHLTVGHGLANAARKAGRAPLPLAMYNRHGCTLQFDGCPLGQLQHFVQNLARYRPVGRSLARCAARE